MVLKVLTVPRVLKGLVLLISPALYAYAAADLISAKAIIRICFCVVALIGLWLTFAGWIAKPRSHTGSN